MKYSFMTFSCPDLTLCEALAVARRFGYDAIEPRVADNEKHGIETTISPAARREVLREVREIGVALSCIATSHRYSDPAKSDAEIKGTVESARLAADVGAPCVRIFGGAIPKGIERAQAIEHLCACLTEASDAIRELPVTLCLETHDSWCDPAHVAEVVQRVNRPNVAVNWDIMHPVRSAGKTIDESFAALRPWVRHVHFHDGLDKAGRLTMVPIGTGPIDHRRAVQLLKQAGYAGYLSGEWIQWEPWEIHLPRELAAMKNYEREVA